MVIKTHRKGKRSAFKKFQDSLCLKKKQKERKNVRNGGLGNLEWLFFLLKKKLMY